MKQQSSQGLHRYVVYGRLLSLNPPSQLRKLQKIQWDKKLEKPVSLQALKIHITKCVNSVLLVLKVLSQLREHGKHFDGWLSGLSDLMLLSLLCSRTQPASSRLYFCADTSVTGGRAPLKRSNVQATRHTCINDCMPLYSDTHLTCS